MRQRKVRATARPPSRHNVGKSPSYPWLSDCEGIMGATLKTDLALVCAALLAAACVLGADLSVAEIVDMIARAL